MIIYFLETGYGGFNLAKVEVEEKKASYKVLKHENLFGRVYYIGKVLLKSDSRIFLTAEGALLSARDYLQDYITNRNIELRKTQKELTQLEKVLKNVK